MNALSTVRSSTPVLASRQLDTLISRFSNALENKPGSYSQKIIPAESAPSDDERQVLEARYAALLNILKPADEHALTRSVATLRAAFPAANDGHENAMLTVKLYVSALSGFPEWAVNDACRKALDGRIGNNPNFAPTPPQMAQACREFVSKFVDERGKLERILHAEIARHTTAEDRARAVEHWEKNVRPALARKPETTKPRETPEEALERHMRNRNVPITIGHELAKKLAGAA